MTKIYNTVRIHEMQLLEQGDLSDDWTVLRVPGGWIFTANCTRGSYPVFVPYSDEFNSELLTKKKGK